MLIISKFLNILSLQCYLQQYSDKKSTVLSNSGHEKLERVFFIKSWINEGIFSSSFDYIIITLILNSLLVFPSKHYKRL